MNETVNTETREQDDPPVTVLVTRRPKPGREKDFEDYVAGITQAAMRQPGHLGTNVFRPAKEKDRSYRILFKFDRRSNLERWENSPERADWHAIADQVSEAREVQTVTGLEAWFDMPDCPVNLHPPKHKMAVVIWMGVYFLVTTLTLLVGPFIADWPFMLRTFVITAMVVGLLTYFVMPFLTKLLKGWLFAHKPG